MNKYDLSDAAKIEILSLNGSDPITFVTQALAAWVLIILTIVAAVHLDSLLFDIFAIFFIASRFNVFALLVHEQVHFLGFRGKYGDWIADLLVSFPLLGVTVRNYAKVHLAHHKFYFSALDPDFHRKSGEDWVFPMKISHAIKLFFKDISGLSFFGTVTGKANNKATPLFNRPNPTPKWLRVIYYLVAAALLTHFGLWQVFLLYWVIPLVTVFQVIIKFGAICEHIYGVNHILSRTTPLIVNKWWEKLLLPNLNFTLHIYHHLYPGISWKKLPKVHSIFVREGLVDKSLVFEGYAAYFAHLYWHNTETQ